MPVNVPKSIRKPVYVLQSRLKKSSMGEERARSSHTMPRKLPSSNSFLPNLSINNMAMKEPANI